MPKLVNVELAKSLMLDIKVMKLQENEGRAYMKSRGCTIGHAKYSHLKKEIDSDPNLRAWIAEQANTGFVAAQRDMIHEIDIISEKLMRMFIVETSKPDYVAIDVNKPLHNSLGSLVMDNAKQNKDKNRYMILRLAERLESLNSRKQSLQLGNPIIANIKTELDQAKAQAMLNPDTDKKDIYIGFKPLVN